VCWLVQKGEGGQLGEVVRLLEGFRVMDAAVQAKLHQDQQVTPTDGPGLTGGPRLTDGTRRGPTLIDRCPCLTAVLCCCAVLLRVQVEVRKARANASFRLPAQGALFGMGMGLLGQWRQTTTG
jgi:hypothetical protein